MDVQSKGEYKKNKREMRLKIVSNACNLKCLSMQFSQIIINYLFSHQNY